MGVVNVVVIVVVTVIFDIVMDDLSKMVVVVVADVGVGAPRRTKCDFQAYFIMLQMIYIRMH